MALFVSAVFIIIVTQTVISTVATLGVLYPRPSESREVLPLNGTWNLRIADVLNPDQGFNGRWHSLLRRENVTVYRVPVPSNYADVLSQDIADTAASNRGSDLKTHRPGWVWYERKFNVPESWNDTKRIFLRIGAAHYHTIVYVNGEQLTKHDGGSIPFVTELPPTLLKFGTPEGMELNQLTVAVNGTLTHDTIPQGQWNGDELCASRSGRFSKCHRTPKDFYRFAGIHDSVFLYTTPMTFIDDVDVMTDYDSKIHTGSVKYCIQARKGDSACGTTDDSGFKDKPECIFTVELRQSYVNLFTGEQFETTVASSEGPSGELVVEPQYLMLWWPYSINLKTVRDRKPGHMYTLKITMTDMATQKKDVYSMKVGIRSIRVAKDGFYINDRPFYFRGIDAEEFQQEREHPPTHLSKVSWYNFNRWMMANSLLPPSGRPLTEEMMEMADQLGLVVINEVPALGLKYFGSSLLRSHKQQMQGLIQRDKNRPSVVMWNMASLATADDPKADEYFRELTEYTRLEDPQQRPLTWAIRAVDLAKDVTAKYMDVATLSWQHYEDGDDAVDSFRYRKVDQDVMLQNIRNWTTVHKKPVLVGEYGIHTEGGMCENSQKEIGAFNEFHANFDALRSEKILIGEMNWKCDQQVKKANSFSKLLARENEGYYREGIRWRYINFAFKMDSFAPEDPTAFLDI